MTKAQERAAQIEANKRDAYERKVRGLLGHVAERLARAPIMGAYEAGTSAEDYAASIASREPVGAAVWPYKVSAVAEAEERAWHNVYAAMRAAGCTADGTGGYRPSFMAISCGGREVATAMRLPAGDDRYVVAATADAPDSILALATTGCMV